VTLPRREFIHRAQRVAMGACAIGAFPALSLGCASAPLVRAQTEGGMARVPFTSLDADGRALVEVQGLDLPVFVRRVAGAPPVALSTRCMHRGCEVEPSTDRLVCPCHGSEYDLNGAVLQGPTQLPLERFRVRESADALLIELGSRGTA
jgi:cytochrome b6-f complex iron-sulfur subunit